MPDLTVYAPPLADPSGPFTANAATLRADVRKIIDTMKHSAVPNSPEVATGRTTIAPPSRRSIS